MDVADSNAKRAIRLAQEGRYSDAMCTLVDNGGRTSADNVEALNDIIARHPHHSLPIQSDNHTISPSITIDLCGVTFALKRFPRGSKLRAQHLLDSTSGSTSPYAPSCLSELTRFINMLLAGKIDARIAPWLVGAPLIALQKKDGGYRPIAVGEVFWWLASRLCCTAVHSFLPDTFLPYNQVGVGIRGGLEAAIHSVNKFIMLHDSEEDLCCLKTDLKNAFNECYCIPFLTRLGKEFPELEPWARWCYSCSGELHFSQHRVESTAGVQQGDPLGPLLFSLTLLELLDKIGEINRISLSTWYLDDGIFIGKKASILSFLLEFSRLGPDLGLHLNLSKCEIFWPSGDQTFIDFPPEISRVLTTQGGVELLGSPIFGLEGFMDNSVKSKVNKVLSMQSHLSDIDDPLIKLHLLRSCLSLCKINYLLRTIPPDLITTSYNLFDSGLHQSIIHSSLDNTSMLQASLPISFGGLGLRRASPSAPAAYIGSVVVVSPRITEYY